MNTLTEAVRRMRALQRDVNSQFAYMEANALRKAAEAEVDRLLAEPAAPQAEPSDAALDVIWEAGTIWPSKEPRHRAFARAALSLRPAPVAEPADEGSSIRIDFKQATKLLQLFGGMPTEMTMRVGDGWGGPGLYVHVTEYPEDGAHFLGIVDGDAIPPEDSAPVAEPAARSLTADERAVIREAIKDSAEVVAPGRLAEPACSGEKEWHQHQCATNYFAHAKCDCSAAAPPQPVATSAPDGWCIDTSTGTKILMFKDCSVIEGEQAELVIDALALFAVPWCRAGSTGDKLKSLFLDAIDWGRTYGRRLDVTDATLDGVAQGFAVLAMDAGASQAREPEWRPIDSAPKDGRTLLLGFFNAHQKWRTLRGQWMSQDYINEYWEEPDDGEPGWYETSVESDDIPNCWATDPTHWMPLPAPPHSDAIKETKNG